ncbi:DoxX family protein [Halomonas dongshanensis]|uniref:DoxX family protein n=1 Tax=Halomonas dongshanensis TaxID=2890835 RepID=A0ABT2EHB7_9GAMM|nr:DoxX family protein [Halomonas dongshanensis]MCS2610988.1 DoxX family protein [Halomonas dongshanensis]
MIGHLLRTHPFAALVWLVLRLYLGITWLHHGIGKMTDGFDAAGFLGNAVANPVMHQGEVVYPTYVAFLEHVALPYASVFNVMIPLGEILVGLGLIAGVLTSWAAFFGIVMNMSFLMAGTVSTNPWMIALTFFLLVAGANAGRLGGDRWVLPYLRRTLFARLHASHGNVDHEPRSAP